VKAAKPWILEKLIHDGDWRVRAAAIETCLAHRDRSAVGWLVDRFAEEKGRLRSDLHETLREITGKDLSLEPRHWKAWWEANRESFTVSSKGEKGSAIDGSTRAEFFKIPILSTKILFVLDLSGSMRDPSPGGASTKLDVARQGLIETIRSLPADVRFSILGLGCDMDGAYLLREKKSWHGKPDLHPATPPMKADAERFVRGLEARGWTNLYDGIEYAFSDPDVDTIYLYSDGGASKGTFVASGEILSQFGKMNRFRKIVIHTVEVPGEKNPEDNRRLLSDIAHLTKGIARLHEKR
jgi:hypothetical protein